MVQAQSTHPQNIFERWKRWVLSFFQREDRPVVSPEQESTTALADTDTGGSHPRRQDIRNTQPTQPTINSFATQFQGAHNFSISGNPTFTNIGVNNGVNNVNTFNNNGGIRVDNRGQRSYDIHVERQYGNTNIGDNNHNGGNAYNFNGNHWPS